MPELGKSGSSGGPGRATAQVYPPTGPKSTTPVVSATLTDPGQWVNNACSAGQDVTGSEVTDCKSATVVAGLPTLTPTPPATSTSTLGAHCYGDSDAEPGPDDHQHARSDVETPSSPTPTA
jgi:hypothetical protein